LSLHKCFNKNFKSDPSQRGATWFYEENPLYFYTKGILTKKREEEILPSTDVDNAEEEEKEDGEGEEEGEDDDDEEGEVTSTLAVVPNEGRGAGDGTEEGGGKSRGRSSRKRKGAAERSESEKSPKTPRNGSARSAEPEAGENGRDGDQKQGGEKSPHYEGKFSIAKVLAYAISHAPDKRLPLNSLYSWFSDNYPAYVTGSPESWKVRRPFGSIVSFSFFLFFFFFFFFISP